MASITITVPNPVAPEIVAALVWRGGGLPQGTADTAQNRQDFAYVVLRRLIRQVHQDWKEHQAKTAAQATAAAEAATATESVTIA